MNFLAHYYFDRINSDPYFNFGLLLPDLLRNFVKGAKLRGQVIDFPFAECASIQAGCEKHIHSDKLFHAWDVFHNSMDEINRLMRGSDEVFEKDFFLSHILVELLIDKILLKANPKLSHELYDDYSSLDMDKIKSYLLAYNISETDKFEEGFNQFMKYRYLHNYVDYPNIVYALGRISKKMKLKPFSVYQNKRLLEISSMAELNLNANIPVLQRLLNDEI